MKKSVSPSRLTAMALVFLALVIGPSLFADSGANHQVSNTNFGVSGGNVNDISRLFCCSGTLGSLVTDGTSFYILSNNHILGRSDQAAPGENISQPGLVDNNCQPPPTVANFTTAPKLGSNVDAAIAQLRLGAMNIIGNIEDVGQPSTSIQAPSVGLAVAKSGRTTGFTTGSIASFNTSVNVQYQAGCGKGKKFVISYTNQVVINSSTFSAGGDSGSLIVSNDACHHPVALLFAGSSTTTIGNPIGEVLSKVSTSLGTSVSFVGAVCTASVPEQPIPDGGQAIPSSESVERAMRAMRSREADLISRPGIIGVGVGASDTGSTDATIVVYVDASSTLTPNVPKRINGVRVRRVYTEPFVAY